MERGPALLCTEGLLAGQRFAITPEGLRIGREAGNEVHIDDAGVSRQHARVLLHNGAVWVQDAGSRNGIFVNGERVPDHKQLKVGDRLTVGAHVFDIAPPAAGAPAPRAAAPAAPVPQPKAPVAAAKAAPRWKIWPFVVAVVLAGGFIACIGLVGALRGDDATSAAAQPAYSLTTLLEPGATPAPAAGGVAPVATPPADVAAPTVADALAVVAGAAPEVALAAVPDPPAGATARQLLDTAQVNYDSGRLADARLQYQQALKLDPTCEICKVRVEGIQAELTAKVQQHLDAGMRAYDAMQFTQAIGAWETVLMLVPDTSDPRHAQAAQYLQKAREASRGR